MVLNGVNNKTYIAKPGTQGAHKAVLEYTVIAQSDNYFLLEINLLTGRKHQIRAQLAHLGCPIKGDLKYGAPRSNPDGSISLHAWQLKLEHPVSHIPLAIEAPMPEEFLWQVLFGLRIKN